MSSERRKVVFLLHWADLVDGKGKVVNCA